MLKNKKKVQKFRFYLGILRPLGTHIQKAFQKSKNAKTAISYDPRSVLGEILPRTAFLGQLSKVNTLLHQVFLSYREPDSLPPGSAHPEASYPTFSDDNMLSNGTYLHANYKTHIQKPSVLHIRLICIEVAGVFSSEYYTLLVVYFYSHKLFLHRRDSGKCIYRPLILFFLRSVNLFNVYNNIYFYFKLFCWGIIPKLRVYLVIIF